VFGTHEASSPKNAAAYGASLCPWCTRTFPSKTSVRPRQLSCFARKFHQLARKIGQGFDWLKDFLLEWNNGVYFRKQKILQAIKD
jgi:hypothetical protein